jgi:hypothetical protein
MPGTGATATRCHALGQDTRGGKKHSAAIGVLQDERQTRIPEAECFGRNRDLLLKQHAGATRGFGANAEVEHGGVQKYQELWVSSRCK